MTTTPGSSPGGSVDPRQVRWVAADEAPNRPRGSGSRREWSAIEASNDAFAGGAASWSPHRELQQREPSRLQRVYSPLPSRGPVAALQPSPLLVEIVRSVAYYRNVPCPGHICPEVILAFDEYLARGVTLKKFVPDAPPHDRFFTIKFLDLQPRRSLALGSAPGKAAAAAMPEAVLCWYRRSSSRNMKRYFPLADLRRVQRGGAGHPYIESRKAKAARSRHRQDSSVAAAAAAAQPPKSNAGPTYESAQENFMLIKNGKKGIFNKYLSDAYVLQFSFLSLLSNCQEVLAVEAPNPTILLALNVVGDYFSRIGYDV